MLTPREHSALAHRRRFSLIGLTGGAGSGKSAAADIFRGHGIPVLDADVIGHELIAPGGAAEHAAVSAFGPDILSGGRIDRRKLGARVFQAGDALEALNGIVHPLIAREIRDRCALHAAAGRRLAVLDAALIAEQGEPEKSLDGLIVVHCNLEKRIERLVAHRGFTREEAMGRAASQTDPQLKLKYADWVIVNDGSWETLQAQTLALIEEWRDGGRID